MAAKGRVLSSIWISVCCFFRMMQIKVNGEQKEISTEVSLLQLLDLLQLSAGQGLALAVNEQVVARSKWSDFVLNDGDQVIIIKATAGG